MRRDRDAETRRPRALVLHLTTSVVLIGLLAWMIATDEGRFADGGEMFITLMLAGAILWMLRRTWREARALRAALRGDG